MKKFLSPIVLLIAIAMGLTSCDDSKSYAELLADENQAVNKFLVEFKVVDGIPADSVFITRDGIIDKMIENIGIQPSDSAEYKKAWIQYNQYLANNPMEDAPYYCIDENSNVYMQVLSVGTDEKPEKNDRVYFRFTRYNMFYYVVGGDNTLLGTGNADSMNTEATFFLFDNTSVSQSTQYGTGIQLPMKFLGYNAKVNLVIKSQDGPTDEMSYVVPYLYTITYYKSMI